MGVQGWTFLLVGLSFALYVGVAIRSRARSTREFYVADAHVPPIANGMATAADWMSAASFLSMAGLVSTLGYDGSVYLMGWTGGFVLLALLLAPYLRKFGKFTVPDFIGDRYESRTARVVAVACAIFVSFTYVGGQMRGVGIVLSRFLEVEVGTGVVIGMAIVFFYAVLGGMKGITWTQVAQYCVLICAYLVPAIFLSFLIAGNAIPQLGLLGDAADGTPLITRLDGLHRELGFASYLDGSKGLLDVACITAALMIGTAGLPHVIVRFYTVPSVRAARKSVGWALVFIALLYTTAPAVALFARINLLDTVSGKPHAEMPEWFAKWEATGLLAWRDQNGDGLLQHTGAKSAVVNELIVNSDIIVLANPEIAGLPDWVIALVAAGALAAALSTAAGLLLVVSTSVSHDLLKRTFVPGITERGELRAARLAAAGAVLAAGWLGIHPPGFVAEVVAFAFGLAASSFFPAILLGIFSVRMNAVGAVSGMLAGIAFTASYILWFKFLHPELSTPEHWWFGISPEGIGALGAALNFAVALAAARLRPPPSAEVRRLIEDIRVPGRAR